MVKEVTKVLDLQADLAEQITGNLCNFACGRIFFQVLNFYAEIGRTLLEEEVNGCFVQYHCVEQISKTCLLFYLKKHAFTTALR